MEAGAVPVSQVEKVINEMIALLEDLYNRMQYVEGPNHVVTYDDYLLYNRYFEELGGVHAQWRPAEEEDERNNIDLQTDAFADFRERLNQAGEKIEGIRLKILAYRAENQGPRGGRRRKTLRKRK